MTNIHYLGQNHYDVHDYIVRMINSGMGYGKGMHAKRKMTTARKVKREIAARNPALAAEQQHAGPTRRKFKTAIALMNYKKKQDESFREWKKMNWGFYYGRGWV
jgi:hypothetical protein